MNSGMFPEERAVLAYDRYIPVVKLGSGGMAEVYLGAQFGEYEFERLVVIKRVHPDRVENPMTYKMFVSEARLVSKLDHPNIVKIYELSKVENELGIVMEYVDGESLSYIVDTMSKIGEDVPLPVILSLMVQACEAIGYAHNARTHDGVELKLIHRDLDARNLMLDGKGYLKVIDFGIAKSTLRNDLTVTRQIKGKIDYLCPDLIHFKDVDGRVDIYSLGLVLFLLLTKHKPLLAPKGTPFWQMIEMMQVNKLPNPTEINPALPADIDAIVAKATEKDRERRFQNGEEFAEAIRRFSKRHSELASPGEVRRWLNSQFPNRLTKRRELEYKVLRRAKTIFSERLMEASSGGRQQEVSRIAKIKSSDLIQVEDELKLEKESKISPWPTHNKASGNFPAVVNTGRSSNPYFLATIVFVFFVSSMLMVYHLYWVPFLETESKQAEIAADSVVDTNLFVDSLPVDAEVFVDGVKIGSTGSVGLSTNIEKRTMHEVVVTKEGFEPYSIVIRGESVGQRRLEVTLTPLPLQEAEVNALTEGEAESDGNLENHGNDPFSLGAKLKLEADENVVEERSSEPEEDQQEVLKSTDGEPDVQGDETSKEFSEGKPIKRVKRGLVQSKANAAGNGTGSGGTLARPLKDMDIGGMGDE